MMKRLNRLLRWAASDRGDADPLMTVITIGISAMLTTAIAGALSVIVLVGSGFVAGTTVRGDVDAAQQLWATTMQNASAVTIYGTTKVVAYAYPDSQPGIYQPTAQDNTCSKTTWQFSGGSITATVERWGNNDCDRTKTTATPTSSVVAVNLTSATVTISAENGGLRDLHFDAAGNEVGLTTTTASLKSKNTKSTGAGGTVTVSSAEWTSSAPKAVNLTGKVATLGGEVKVNWLGTTGLRPNISTASVDEGLYFTPMSTVRFNLGTVTPTPVTTTIAGVNGIPADAAAVVMNVAVASPTSNLYAHVTAAGTTYDVAQVWAKSGVTGSQYATVPLAAGKVQTMVNTGSASMYLDVSGYYSKDKTASTYFPQKGTRAATASLSTTQKAVTLSGIPANATAVAVNVQVVSPSSSGYIRVAANGAADTSNAQQYFTASTDTSNLIVMGVTNRALQAKLSAGSATAYFDVVGYYAKDPAGATFVPVDLTSRTWSGSLSTTKSQVQVADSAGVPTNASAVVANLYLTTITNTGYVQVGAGTDDTTLYPQRPVVASVNTSTPVMELLTDGQINIKASAGTLKGYFDVSGFFQAPN